MKEKIIPEIRRLEFKDLDNGFYEALENLTVVGNISQKGKKVFNEISNNSLYNIFIAEYENKVVGTITLLLERKFIHGGGLVGHIEDVATNEDFEGKGVGSSLVDYAIKYAKEKGCYKVVLDCSEENVSFYEKMGLRRHEFGMRIDL